MKVSKTTGGGAWLDKKALRNGDLAKLVSEATEIEGQNGMQLVAKIRIKGAEDTRNVGINTPTKNALIEAFGDDTKEWINKVLEVSTEKTLIAGKRGIALYLIPEGYHLTEDDGGYLVIMKKTARNMEQSAKPPVDDYPEELDGEIPF